MTQSELFNRFQSCVRYKQARSWQKPWIDFRRFAANQLRKHGLSGGRLGELRQVDTFHVPAFTIVNGENVSEQIGSYGVYEIELTEAFLRLVRKDQVVIDIGMHLGYYTALFALLTGPGGQVHAFEPTPSTREIARRNTDRFKQVQVHPYAAWSSRKRIAFRDYGVRWMAFNSAVKERLDVAPVVPEEIEVPAITLDEFRSEIGRPIGLVKIDAEHAEHEILLGASQMLRADRPLLSVEVGGETGALASSVVLEQLRELDYQPWQFESGRFARHQPQQTYGYDNLIMAPSGVDLSGS